MRINGDLIVIRCEKYIRKIYVKDILIGNKVRLKVFFVEILMNVLFIKVWFE